MCINDITRDGAIVDTQDEEASETIGTTSTSSISSLSKKMDQSHLMKMDLF